MKRIKYLIVCPTALEAGGLVKEAVRLTGEIELFSLPLFNQVDMLISGIGINKTTYSLTKALTGKNYDFVIHIGIAGSYNNHLELGSVVNIQSETYGDMGIESQNGFTSLFDLNLMNKNEFPFTNGKLINKTLIPQFFAAFPSLNGVTVNSLSTIEKTNKKRKELFNAQIESMEGAAVFFTCLMEKIDFVEIRAISNYVGERNKKRWKIDEAIKNLNKAASEFFMQNM